MTKIRWDCDTCKEHVGDGNGWITINYDQIHDYEQDKTSWEAEHPGPVIRLSEYDTHPDHPHWHVWHRECDPDINSNDYTIDIERIRTQGEMLSWTAHLMEKNWFPTTNWPDVIRRALTQKELHV